MAVCLDEASRLGYAMPLEGAGNISTTAAEQAFVRGWLSWAGPPSELQLAPASAFTSSRWEQPLVNIGVTPRPTPPEAHWAQ